MKLMKKPDGFTIENSQIAKGLAIIWLLIFHLFSEEATLVEMNVHYSPFRLKDFLLFSGFGKITVAMFVVLSAYGIAYKILSSGQDAQSAYDTAFKRFFKLMKNFFILYISVLAAFGFFFSASGLQDVYGAFPQGLLNMLCDSLGLAETFGTGTLNVTWWYMDLAYMLIFIVPLITLAARKIGYAIIPLAVIIPAVLSGSYTGNLYWFSAVMGVAAAYGNWFEKLMNIKLPAAVKWLIGICGTVAAIILRGNPIIIDYYLPQFDGLIAVFMIWTGASLFSSVPLLRDCLAILGRNSLNIFLIHTFFFLIVFRNQVYYFKNPVVIFLVLLVLSLVYSLLLEFVKKHMGNLLKKLWQKKNTK